MSAPASTPPPAPSSPPPSSSSLGAALADFRANLRYDLPASLVVFLVAVPLSLGIAVASDAPLTAGLIAAAIGGIVAGTLGGSALQVSGPAAGLTVIVADLVNRFGWGVTCAITVAAGLLQLVFGFSKAGRAALAISPAVVHGMLAGIGVTIVLGQLHVVLGGEQQDDAIANVLALPGQLISVHGPAATLGLAVIAILLAWPRLPRSVPAWIQGIPAPLLAVTLLTVVASVLMLPVERVEVGGSVLDAIALPVLPTSDLGGVIVGVFTVAIIASIESLLSAVAVDKLRPGQTSNLDRELVGQGAGNTLSGLLGGLPITGVIVRSSTNAAAGARSRTSAVLHGVWIVVFSVALLGLVQQIPMAVLAGLLVHIGAKLVNIAHMRELHRHGELPIYVVTILGVVFVDLLTGVLIGLGLALLMVLRRVVWASIEVQEPSSGQGTWHVVVEGALCFLSVPRLSRRLARIPEGADVVVDLVTDYLDHAAFDHLSEWEDRHRLSGGSVRVDEVGTMGLVARREATAGGPGDRRPGPVPRFLAPWSVWQAGHDATYGEGWGHGHRSSEPCDDGCGGASGADPILTGLREYHRRAAGLVAPYLSDLADGQAPHAWFLTCSDSRVVPNVLTSSGPGDLFTVRNVGNLAPLGGRGDDSVGATVEYALDALHVPTLVVCGHSGCGAMQAVLRSDGGFDGALGRWLEGASESLSRFRSGHPVGEHAGAAVASEVDRLAMVNVAVQLDRLARHPGVATAVEEGRVRLVGLFFDIATARMSVLDGDRFVPASTDRLGAGTRSGAELDHRVSSATTFPVSG
ncbi:bifunctional SulP family inorganic anion transporter/carbonic anhydrase [Actinomycetospora endophytica]|uniref:carbonic anhydrase n=1 Tax=Actinomycetospora endophytica TaxID=2291215 RepID=A0ABS8PDS2_9PSEU|nr:bifunctional SulP family inorganic anion transporter/carbonic anhydrase [Actinomycetospora endophytica]MCD2196427.1 bifunctional SulP family inorganic anion transporter/carbonic anhydrase [Actinomycetospora endophytica]